MKRYLIFRWEKWEACGGWHDLIGSTDTRLGAKRIATTFSKDYAFSKQWHIVDSKTWEIVDKGTFDDTH